MSAWLRQKNWWNEVLWKPKKSLSLEQLKFQHQVLIRNPVVTDNNKKLLVETFRSIAEILIWGDQNDSRVFDYFLEKNMQTFFLKTLTQKCGRYVCLQLLQTLNILFENIRNETSIYYLLSNNHINSIIVLKLDFSDEEVLAYYISFLKTLSFKLNKHTVHFFYNEHLRDFPLYTEAIKFFNNSESMVRIAVRTLTLNVYKVDDSPMLEYIRNKTAAPYFSNLVWFMGNHIIELDECLMSQAHHLNRGRLEQLVAEHLDHLHYITDILSLSVETLNQVLVDHLLNRLLIPLYVYSLTDQRMSSEEEGEEEGESPRISSTISLFLLSQVLLTVPDPAVITPLTYLIFTGDTSLCLPPPLLPHQHNQQVSDDAYCGVRGFLPPEASLESSLKHLVGPGQATPMSVRPGGEGGSREGGEGRAAVEGSSTESQSHMRETAVADKMAASNSVDGYVDIIVEQQYVLIEASPPSSQTTPPELQTTPSSSFSSTRSTGRGRRERNARPEEAAGPVVSRQGIPVVSTVFLDTVMDALSVRTDDSRCLFTLALIHAMLDNPGVHPKLLEAFSFRPPPSASGSVVYNSELVTLLLAVLDTATASGNSLRLVTLRLAIMLLTKLLAGGGGGGGDTTSSAPPVLQDQHFALIENIYESAILQLRLFYKGPADEIFLDMFEDEYNNETGFRVKLSYLMMDASMLLPPTDTPLTGIEFTRRLPCGETERARKAMRVFFAIRRLSQQISGSEEKELPLTMPSNSATIGDIVDLNNCDLVSCVVTAAEKTIQRFMVVTETEFLLVDPDKKKLGWGVVHFIAFLQDVDISADPADSCALFIVVHGRSSTQKRPALSAKFQFEDHIRCLAARQCLQRSREHLRLAKMARIAKLLHLPVPEVPSSALTQPIPLGGRPFNPQLDLPASVISLDSTPPPSSLPLDTTQLSTSVLHKVFMPSPSSTGNGGGSQQAFEMTSFKPYHSQDNSDDTLLDSSSLRLPDTSPFGEVLLDTAGTVLYRPKVPRLEVPDPSDSLESPESGMSHDGASLRAVRERSVEHERQAGASLFLEPQGLATEEDEEGKTLGGSFNQDTQASANEQGAPISVDGSYELNPHIQFV